MEIFVQLGLFLYKKNLEKASKDGKSSQMFPWKVGCQLYGGEREVRGRTEDRVGGRTAKQRQRPKKAFREHQ